MLLSPILLSAVIVIPTVLICAINNIDLDSDEDYDNLYV